MLAAADGGLSCSKAAERFGGEAVQRDPLFHRTEALVGLIQVSLDEVADIILPEQKVLGWPGKARTPA